MSSSEQGRERRAHKRYGVSFRVSLMRQDSQEMAAEVTQISGGGCFVATGREVRDGDLVKLQIDIPGHGDLTIWGEVVYQAEGRGFGVHFSAFSQGGARDKLAMILDEEERRA
jgi:hypothetical protein